MEHVFEPEQPAIPVVGHGTRSIAGADAFNRLAKHFRDVLPRRDRAIGFLEFARPTIDEGLRQLISRAPNQLGAPTSGEFQNEEPRTGS